MFFHLRSKRENGEGGEAVEGKKRREGEIAGKLSGLLS